MRLEQLEIDDFQGIKHVHLDLPDFGIVCGPNWSGKTSIQQAIRMVLTGDVARVDLKGEYKLLVREGRKAARVTCTWDGKARVAVLSATGGHEIPGAAAIHPALLDQHRISRASLEERKALLYELLDVKIERGRVAELLIAKEVPQALVDEVIALFAAGFPAMQKYADTKSSEARGAWKAIAGETYGPRKAEDWEPKPREDLPGSEKVVWEYSRAEEFVEKAQAELNTFEPGVQAMRVEFRQGGSSITCPHCGKAIAMVSPERMDELRALLPEQEGALDFMRTALQNRRNEAERWRAVKAEIDADKKRMEEGKAKALAAHRQVEAWVALADLLAPDGIPAEILTDQLQPLNARLRATAEILGLGQVSINPDMHVRKDGRIYGLLSEAEQWITDAMLIEALSSVTGARFVMLDRLDVLDITVDGGKRSLVVGWLLQLARDHEQQVLLFATLKAPPQLGDDVLSVWLNNGEITAW